MILADEQHYYNHFGDLIHANEEFQAKELYIEMVFRETQAELREKDASSANLVQEAEAHHQGIELQCGEVIQEHVSRLNRQISELEGTILVRHKRISDDQGRFDNAMYAECEKNRNLSSFLIGEERISQSLEARRREWNAHENDLHGELSELEASVTALRSSNRHSGPGGEYTAHLSRIRQLQSENSEFERSLESRERSMQISSSRKSVGRDTLVLEEELKSFKTECRELKHEVTEIKNNYPDDDLMMGCDALGTHGLPSSSSEDERPLPGQMTPPTRPMIAPFPSGETNSILDFLRTLGRALTPLNS